VLELGAGTGVLGVLLHQLFLSWTISDQFDHLKLISRNVTQNGNPKNIHVEEIDWMDIHAKWLRAKTAHSGARPTASAPREEYDLVVAVDCIYNEALIPPFVSTLEYHMTKGKTIALVVCELRSSDVVSEIALATEHCGRSHSLISQMTTFLEEWISRGGWTIYRLSDMAVGDELKYNFVVWVAWKSVV
jgi:hypothetical protein